MTSEGQQPVERLREYLRTLKPDAQAMLVAELERGLLRGEEMPGGELVLQELRRAIRAGVLPVTRIGDAARLFFMPLEPFLIDSRADHKRAGRLARISLEPIWEWICRDLMPAEARALSEDINRALAADERTRVDQLVRALHERAIQRIAQTLAAVAGDEKAQRKLGVQVGTPRPIDDLTTLHRILTLRDVLADLVRRLPAHIRAFERDYIDPVKTFLDAATAAKAAPSAGTRKADIMQFGLVAVAARLAVPWQLIRIATRAADSDEPARIAETPYAVAVPIVLGEIESMVGEMRSELKSSRPITSLLKDLHDAARGLRTEMNLEVESAWSRQLAAIRSEISGLLKGVIEAIPGRVRRLLRPRPEKEIAPGSMLDAGDVAEVGTLVEFAGACRHYASELALSEVTLRTNSELGHYLETGTKVLLDSLRHAGDADRPFRQSQVDAAIRFCRTVFGVDYAGLLVKAADVAIQTGAMQTTASERKIPPGGEPTAAHAPPSETPSYRVQLPRRRFPLQPHSGRDVTTRSDAAGAAAAL